MIMARISVSNHFNIQANILSDKDSNLRGHIYCLKATFLKEKQEKRKKKKAAVCLEHGLALEERQDLTYFQ